MSLCLYVLAEPEDDQSDPEELAECEIGHYSDFDCFRLIISRHLDLSRFPTLLCHSDCEGEWTVEEIPMLVRELNEIAEAFKKLPAEQLGSAFEHTRDVRIDAKCLYDCFHDVDGKNLFESLLELSAIAVECDRPITFM